MNKDRLDKIIASQGLVTRSEAKELIKRGMVTVNGEIITDASLKCDYDNDVLTVNGERISQKKYVYIMLNKPKGVVSASKAPGDVTVVDILPENLKRKNLFPAGRLDRDTTGFCLITDDGDFAHNILSPSHHIEKTYIATVSKPIDYEKAKKAFEKGVVLADGTVLLSAKLTMISNSDNPSFEVIVSEGKYHQIKKMFLTLGTEVTELKRIKMGGLLLDSDLKEGESRLISADELSLFVKNDE